MAKSTAYQEIIKVLMAQDDPKVAKGLVAIMNNPRFWKGNPAEVANKLATKLSGITANPKEANNLVEVMMAAADAKGNKTMSKVLNKLYSGSGAPIKPKDMGNVIGAGVKSKIANPTEKAIAGIFGTSQGRKAVGSMDPMALKIARTTHGMKSGGVGGAGTAAALGTIPSEVTDLTTVAKVAKPAAGTTALAKIPAGAGSTGKVGGLKGLFKGGGGLGGALKGASAGLTGYFIANILADLISQVRGTDEIGLQERQAESMGRMADSGAMSAQMMAPVYDEKRQMAAQMVMNQLAQGEEQIGRR